MSGNFESSRGFWSKISLKEYRDSYIAAHVRRWVARQIRTLREQPERRWKQGELAIRLGKPQSVISRLEDPNYGNMTISTLLELASAFDVALIVKFVSFSRFKGEIANLETDALMVSGFEQEVATVSMASQPIVVTSAGAPPVSGVTVSWPSVTYRDSHKQNFAPKAFPMEKVRVNPVPTLN